MRPTRPALSRNGGEVERGYAADNDAISMKKKPPPNPPPFRERAPALYPRASSLWFP